jgi:hypothetical protein
MTDEELKEKLLQKTYGRASGKEFYRNPEGPQAVAYIEKLEAHIRVLLDNDPNAQLYPEWRSVLDVWRDEARHTLRIKGTNDD